ncbi:MAG: 1,4-dihydroxy-2-naphthoate polyprenyltransferase [Flavobacteriales bacterium]
MAALKDWIEATRPRTLPLAIASILLGSMIALADGDFKISILVLGLLTTLFLQVLSNFANDYGDSVTGVDNETRVGPERSVQKGAISMTGMRTGMLISSLLALISGVWLLVEGLGTSYGKSFYLFLTLGLFAIVAAIKYTVGKRPYGYLGAGDLFVFLFFGWVGVLGIHFLHTRSWNPSVLLPATSFGLMATGVLNLNNLRDRIQDEKNGKRTLAVRWGKRGGAIYHSFLLIIAMLLPLLHSSLFYRSPWQFLYLIAFPLFIIDLLKVHRKVEHEQLDPELKRVALGALIYAISFGGGLILG